MTMGGRVDMKVVMLGREAGGKTSLVQRYLYDRFSGNLPYQAVIIITLLHIFMEWITILHFGGCIKITQYLNHIM